MTRPIPLPPGRRAWLTALLMLALAPAQAQTDDAALLRCAALPETAARLACFEQLASQARERAAARAKAPAGADARQVAEFGRPPRPEDQALQVIESRMRGRFEGWVKGQRIELANGQVWQVTDDSGGHADLVDPLVRVSRAALGSFLMEVEGLRRAARVRRVQ